MITFGKNGRVDNGTWFIDGVPTMDAINVLVYAFELSMATNAYEPFDKHVKAEVARKFGIKPNSQILTNVLDRKRPNRVRARFVLEPQARVLAYTLFASGVVSS